MLNKILIFLCSVYLSCALYSCGTSRSTTDTPDLSDIDNVQALPEVAVKADKGQVLRTEKTKYWLLRHTQLDLRPHIESNVLKGEALLWLEPLAAGSTRDITLDAKYMKIDSLAICSNPILSDYQNPIAISPVLDYDNTPYKLNINLDKVYNPGDTLCLYIRYEVLPDSVPSGGSSAIRERKGVYMLHPDEIHASRPTQLWTQGEPESASFWFPTLDAPNQKTTEVLRVHYPSNMLSLSNGLLTSSDRQQNTKTDVWSNMMPTSPYLFTLVVADMHLDSSGQYRDKVLSYLVDHEYAAFGPEIFDHTAEMLRFFSDITGVEYPWQKYAQVIVHDFVSGAMENTSAVTFGKFVQKNDRELIDKNNDNIVAHEMFHHWFGDLVTFESWTHISLSESFATLGPLLWRAHHEGPLRVAVERHSMLQTYLRAAKEDEPPLLRKYYDKPGEVFDRISYQKGAIVLYMLRHDIGEKNFNAAMKHYLQTHAYGTAEIEDWRQALEYVTGRDFTEFFEQWYYTPRLPRLRMKVVHDTTLQQTEVEVSYVDESPIYNIAPELLCVPVDSTPWRMTLRLDDSTQHWSIPYINGHPVHTILDPEHTLAADIRYLCDESYWKRMFTAPLHYDQVYNAIKYLENSLSDSDVQLSLARLAQRNEVGISELASRYLLPNNSSETLYREKYEKIVADPTAESELRAQLIRVLASPPDSSNDAWLKNLCSDQSYRVCAAALEAIDSTDHSYAMRYALDSLSTARGALYSTCLALLSLQDTDIYIPRLITEVDRQYGRDCYLPSHYLDKALRNVKSMEVYRSGVDALITKASRDDLKELDEYILKSLYNSFVVLTKKEEKEKAEYIKNQVENTLYPSWDDPERIEDLKEIYTWQVKF